MSHGTNVELAWRDLGIEIEKLQEECRDLVEQVARFRSLDTVADLIQKAESLEADRDRWKATAIHVVGLGCEECPIEDCYYCRLAHGAMSDHVVQSIRLAARGD